MEVNIRIACKILGYSKKKYYKINKSSVKYWRPTIGAYYPMKQYYNAIIYANRLMRKYVDSSV